MTENTQEFLQRSEPRPAGVRISQLPPEARAAISQFRFEYLFHLLRAAGCAVTPDPKGLALNFHTSENLIIATIDQKDPRRICLNIITSNSTGDLQRADLACAKINGAPCCTKACVRPYGTGFELHLVAGIIAEDLSAFTNSLKAYTDDIVEAYNMFIDEMIRA